MNDHIEYYDIGCRCPICMQASIDKNEKVWVAATGQRDDEDGNVVKAWLHNLAKQNYPEGDWIITVKKRKVKKRKEKNARYVKTEDVGGAQEFFNFYPITAENFRKYG